MPRLQRKQEALQKGRLLPQGVEACLFGLRRSAPAAPLEAVQQASLMGSEGVDVWRASAPASTLPRIAIALPSSLYIVDSPGQELEKAAGGDYSEGRCEITGCSRWRWHRIRFKLRAPFIRRGTLAVLVGANYNRGVCPPTLL